jgi:hypothetical protein
VTTDYHLAKIALSKHSLSPLGVATRLVGVNAAQPIIGVTTVFSAGGGDDPQDRVAATDVAQSSETRPQWVSIDCFPPPSELGVAGKIRNRPGRLTAAAFRIAR